MTSTYKPITTEVKLPQTVKNLYFPPTDLYENLLTLYPLTGTSFTVSQTSYKVQWELPNLLAIRMDELWVECYMTPMFTSTNSGDTFGTVLPAFVPYMGPSSIERIQVQIGSNTAIDNYGVALMNNLMINLTTNAVVKNSYQFLGIDGQPQPATQSTGQPVFTRFKLRYFTKDQLNENAILPLGRIPKVLLSVWFTAPQFNMYYAGTPAGTITLSYGISNLQLQVMEVASPTLMAALKTNTLNWCGRELYYQPITLTQSGTQYIQVPSSFKYVRGILFVLRRVQDVDAMGPTAITKLQEYSPDVSSLVRLNVKINGVKRQLQDFQNLFEWYYELVRLFPDAAYSDYFVRSKIGPDAVLTSATNVRTIYGLLVGKSYDTETESGIDTGNISSAITIEIVWTNSLSSVNTLELYIIHDRWISIDPSGQTLLVE